MKDPARGGPRRAPREAPIRFSAASPAARVRLASLGTGLALLTSGLLISRRLDREVMAAADGSRLLAARVKPLAFTPLVLPSARPGIVGDGTVAAAALANGVLLTAGGSGLHDGRRAVDTLSGLPSLRASAVAFWRGTPVFALERGGWGRLTERGPEEATGGWGRLRVRTIVETAGGELLLGAREGLFRAVLGAGELERLDEAPVRALALLPAGEIAAGGETGLSIVSPSGAPPRAIATPDAWVDGLGFDEGWLWAGTPVGVSLARLDRRTTSLAPHPRGGDATGGVLVRGSWSLVPPGDAPAVASLLPDGSRREETTPERFRRLLAAGDDLLGDGPSGLFRRDPARGWVLQRPRPAGSLPLPHVNALAETGRELWAGFFDGGLARAGLSDAGRPLEWTSVAGSDAWGVNALLPAGGALFAATLRGAYRIEGKRAVPLDGAGGAFSLAAIDSGIAIGYGQGVLVPGKRLLSAFHGLPGNQACALAPTKRGAGLWVGTPSGLGRVERLRVALRTTPGDGKLPHPWVTALLERRGALYVATYGGGVARRTGEGAAERWERFPETSDLKVNAGAMAVDREGRIWIGTEGRGLWRTGPDGTGWDRLDLPLPSPDVFSLAFVPADAPRWLYAGTGEGLARIDLGPSPGNQTLKLEAP